MCKFLFGITVVGIIALLSYFVVVLAGDLSWTRWTWVVECITLTGMIWYTPSILLDKDMYERKK